MENKKKEKVKKKKINQFKILRFLLIACAIAFLVKFILDKNVFEDMKITNRVNSSLPLSVTIQDAVYVKLYSIDRYVNFLQTEQYSKAYNMLTKEYKEFKTYNEFLYEIAGIDFSTFKLKEVKQIAERTYLAPVEYKRNGVLEEEEYIVLANNINDKNMKISLNKFLYHFPEKQKFSKDGIKYTIEECVVKSNVIKLTVTVKNGNFFEEVEIKEIGLGFDEESKKMQTIEKGILKAGETQTYDIEIESNYYIPKYLQINRNIDGEIMRTYLFELDNN
ncbi:MAG: hypothetical protein IKK43_03970 [Clostridia bacterium]|nr:hypothetical protein [Clostridia bacterium]